MTRAKPPRNVLGAHGVTADWGEGENSSRSSRQSKRERDRGRRGEEEDPFALGTEEGKGEAEEFVADERSRMLIPMLPAGTAEDEQQRTNQAKGVAGALTQYQRFEKDLPNILQLLDTAEQDGAISAINKSLLASVLATVPIAINKYQASGLEFHAYALGAILTQVRNIIADLQAGRDRSIVSDRINKVLVKGAFVMMIQHFSELNAIMKADLSDKVKPEYIKAVSLALDANLKTMARYMNETYEQLSEDITRILTE